MNTCVIIIKDEMKPVKAKPWPRLRLEKVIMSGWSKLGSGKVRSRISQGGDMIDSGILGRVYFVMGLLCLIGGPIIGNLLIPKGKELVRQATFKSRIDPLAVSLLQGGHGLMFVTPDVETIRFLVQEGILSYEYFPSSPITWGYVLTNPGKEFLKRFPIELFPDIVIDMHRVRYWYGSQKNGEFQQKEANFKKAYSKEFKQCVDGFFNYIPKDFINLAVEEWHKNINDYPDKLDIFSRFLEDRNIAFEDKMVVIKEWEKTL